MQTAKWMACWFTLAGCARGAIALEDDGGAWMAAATSAEGGGSGALEAGRPGDAAVGGGPGSDSGDDTPVGGAVVAPTPVGCPSPAALCEHATQRGEIDGSDEASAIQHEGAGSAWLGVDVVDSNRNATGNSRIGIGVTLTAAAGASYTLTLVGDTSPGGGGRCGPADVTDTDPLHKTAIWGSYGPSSAAKRTLAVHVEYRDGPCGSAWTLNLQGNPCPAFSVGFGDAALGSCP